MSDSDFADQLYDRIRDLEKEVERIQHVRSSDELAGLIERVAAAICKADELGDVWEYADKFDRERYRTMAKAAYAEITGSGE